MALKLLNIILIIYLAKCSGSALKFTNVRCTEFDPNFALFKVCKLRLLKRETVALDIHVKVLQVPINNVSVNLSFLKKANGYKPFLYNISSDFCQFMKNRNQLPFLKIFINILKETSNINHTCPYNHDIIVRNLVLQEEMFKYLPLPTGDYMMRLKVGVCNKWKADVMAYFEFVERNL